MTGYKFHQKRSAGQEQRHDWRWYPTRHPIEGDAVVRPHHPGEEK